MAGRGPGTGRRNTVSSNRSLRSTALVASSCRELEAVDRHSLLRPAAALDADVARRDVPAAVVHGHAEGLALTGHGNAGEHDDEPGSRSPSYTQRVPSTECCISVMRASSAPVERFVPVGERDLQQRAAGGDEVGLHADATVGIVEAVGPDHLDGNVSGDGPHGWVGAHSAMSSALVGVIVARWKRAMAGERRGRARWTPPGFCLRAFEGDAGDREQAHE